MRKFVLAAATAACAMPVAFAAPASAQRATSRVPRPARNAANAGASFATPTIAANITASMRECQRELRRAQNRDWRTYRNYDYNRYEPGNNAYYADRYYRDGRYYGETRLSRNDRIYRGSDGRYYCRRSDGTTGLIIGGAVGGLLGNAIDNGRSSMLGTLIGAGAGAALGREIQRGSVRCR